MKCEMCHLREATVHLTEVINNKVAKLSLCEECAKQKGEEMQSHFGLTDLLSSLMDFGSVTDERGIQTESTVQCPVCKMTYQDFQKHGKLGCSKCYDAFDKELSALLKKIHGADKHTGKIPFMGKQLVKDQETLQRLKKELQMLVRSEQFEKAVIMRDRIKELEKKLNVE
ncbi:MAG TPA: UvrB/UvrC motif-containing protein [Candidatus Omnitrophota bacterium]|nr:UvrB/UvrC motif-containing protein [Candidatus Omnitrophota bacterium]HPS20417.1 UvrB/UvrC motif-containing protein [Candidatus Omnitrophota bacterium]